MSLGFVKTHEIFRVSACALIPAAVTFGADLMRSQSNFLGRVCSYIPLASAPYVLELSIIYCAAAVIFSESNHLRSYSPNRPRRLLSLTQQSIIFCGSTVFVTLLSPSVRLGKLEMGKIDFLTTIKCTLLTAVVELVLGYLKITPQLGEVNQLEVNQLEGSGTPRNIQPQTTETPHPTVVTPPLSTKNRQQQEQAIPIEDNLLMSPNRRTIYKKVDTGQTLNATPHPAPSNNREISMLVENLDINEMLIDDEHKGAVNEFNIVRLEDSSELMDNPDLTFWHIAYGHD